METLTDQIAAFMIGVLLMAGAIITGWLAVGGAEGMYQEPQPKPAATTEYIDA
jgi:hypothetical protein